ncbi:transposase, partial [Ilumatobacter sp.]|uniref:transposase n=1 Tax=Ilumatobacter sp. TaxID=1967498 RepID=UPI003751055D
MPKAFPPEFRDEVVRVARRREQPLRQTAKDFGVSESCLNRWLSLDEIESGDRPGVTKAEAAETRELNLDPPCGCWFEVVRVHQKGLPSWDDV